jgi:conjugative relaxase-like TrwC/TraI family protein
LRNRQQTRFIASYSRLQTIFRGEQCTKGAFARANAGGEGAVGVVADIAKLSVGREAYYTRELATDHEQYLSGHGESPGRWYGAGASSLGLQGEASVAGFQAMFEGRGPTTGELLGRPHGRNAVPAFDVVLRPTKSVSILYGLGDPATGRAVLAAHHAGLAEAVGYLDGHLGARRGHGGVQHVSGQGLLAVGFDHRTSREGDPLLHTHLVVANRVQGPDGRWTALDGRDLYRHRLAADAIYRATYQRELVRTLGVEWTAADTHGNRELQGVPEALVRSFSKRAGQIDAELDRLVVDGGERTPRLVKWAVQATRKPKQHETPDTLYNRWRAEAAERGHDADTLVREVTGWTSDRIQDQRVSAEAVGRLLDRLAGPEGLTATASTFTRPEVLVALGAGLAGATRAELEELADRFLVERAVSVVADRAVEERRWSTPDLLAVEQRLVTRATGRTEEQTAVASHQAVRIALAAHSTAGPDQQAMVHDLCQGGQGVALVVGRAGTGKTFALGMARHAWQLDGYRLLASAPTGIATMSLQGEGFEDVATCDRLLADLDGGWERLDARTVLVVDEAGMVGSRKLARLLEHAEQAQAKVVLVGDDRQLAPIDAGGGFRALRLRLGASELVENRRQHQAWEREALELVRSGLVEEAVAAYRAHDRVVAADSKPAATLALLQHWWAAWQQADHDPAQEVVVLAARRAEVDRLNTACQELLAARGRLGGERLGVEDRQLAVGDRVVCGKNAIGELGVANGSRGIVTALGAQARTLTVRLDGTDGREVVLPGSYLDGRVHGERNRRVDLAYATTGHRAQGLTRGRALVRLTGTEDVNWLYVQLSRARQDTRLYGSSAQNLRAAESWIFPIGSGRTRTCSWPMPCRGRAVRPWPSTPPTASITSACPRPSCGPSGTGSVANSTRPQATAAASWPGPAPTASRPRRPWPPTSHRPAASRAACFAGCVAVTSPTPCPGGWRWPPNRPTAPMTGNGSCASTSSAATAGWKPTRRSASSIGRWCGPWPGSGAPPAWRLRVTGLVMSSRRWDRCRRRPGVGGPGGRPPPRSRTTGAATTSPIRTGPSDPNRITQSSGPIGSGPAPPSSGSRPSSAPPTVPATPNRPASPLPSRDLLSSVAGQGRSGPPASPSSKEDPDGQSPIQALR